MESNQFPTLPLMLRPYFFPRMLISSDNIYINGITFALTQKTPAN